MKNLLYIGHSYHQKTKSTRFIIELLQTQYQVSEFYFDPACYTLLEFTALKEKHFDIVVLFQVMPSVNTLKEYISFDQLVFVPMFDGMLPLTDSLWLEYQEAQIINFCYEAHQRVQNAGFTTHYIQYFPKSIDVQTFGNPQSLFFWQRVNQITFQTIEQLFEKYNLHHVHFHRSIDPYHTLIEPSKEWQDKVTFSDWYEQKSDMLQDIEKAALYMAPRPEEGIGMSFLEAMAMGRCVIAPNQPTMNEYIKNGKTGYLYDLKTLPPLDIQNVKQIQQKTKAYIKEGFAIFEQKKYDILKWVEEKAVFNAHKYKKFQRKIFLKKAKLTLLGKWAILHTEKKDQIKKTYLFEKIPLLKIKYKNNTKKIFLFGGLCLYSKKNKNQAVSIKTAGATKNALVCYLKDSILLSPKNNVFNFHSNLWESREIINALREQKYNVDVINWDDKKFVPQKKYDVIFDISDKIAQYIDILPKNALKLLHLTGSFAPYQNSAEEKRCRDFDKRHGTKYMPKRQVQNIPEVLKTLELADYCSLVGNEYTKQTFPSEIQSKISLIPVTPSALKWIKTRQEIEHSGNGFLYFAGGGNVHKGLDLVLDIFEKHPDWSLHLVCPIEDDFKETYHTILAQPHIHVHGYMDVASDEFIQICKQCRFYVFPSCSEATSTAAVTALSIGLFPILSIDTGVNLPEKCGIVLKNITLDSLEEAIKSAQILPSEIVTEQTYKVQQSILKTYNRPAFAKEIRAYLEKVLK